jgi:hypothetical protein
MAALTEGFAHVEEELAHGEAVDGLACAAEGLLHVEAVEG